MLIISVLLVGPVRACLSYWTGPDIPQFFTWNSIFVYIKYSEYYAAVPISATEIKIMPVPYQLVRQLHGPPPPLPPVHLFLNSSSCFSTWAPVRIQLTKRSGPPTAKPSRKTRITFVRSPGPCSSASTPRKPFTGRTSSRPFARGSQEAGSAALILRSGSFAASSYVTSLLSPHLCAQVDRPGLG
jgi:hypothetical protein